MTIPSCRQRAGVRSVPEWLFVAALPGILLCSAASQVAAQAPAANGDDARTPQLAIKVDQVGYPLDGPKVALVSAPATTFQVRRGSDNSVVLEGKLGAARPDKDTGDLVQAADFSRLRQPGNYYLDVPGVGRSWNFTVGPNVFERTYYMAMRAFYGQRCGTAVDLGPEFPGYSHPACHLHGEFTQFLGSQRAARQHRRLARRGRLWTLHGQFRDHHRYLLWTWEIYGEKLKDISLKIPESGNGTPDILNEARWNLEWMLKMQDGDGGAWHKQTSESFPGMIAPEDDTLPSEVIGTGQAPFKEHLRHRGPGGRGRHCRTGLQALRRQVCRAVRWMRRGAPGPGRRRIPM
jgi:endoglucanase